MADCPHQGLDAFLCSFDDATPASNQLALVSELDLSKLLADDLACLHGADDDANHTAAGAAGCHASPLSPADSCHSDHESAPPQHRQQLTGQHQQSHQPHLCRQPSHQQAATSAAVTRPPVVAFCGAHGSAWQQQQQQQQHVAAGPGSSWTLQSLTPVSTVVLPAVPVPHPPPAAVSVGRGPPANPCCLIGGHPFGSSHLAGPGHVQAAVLPPAPPPQQQHQQQCHPLWQQQMQLLSMAPRCLQPWQQQQQMQMQQQMQVQMQQQRALLMLARQGNAAAMMRVCGPGGTTARSVAHRASAGSRKRSSQSQQQQAAAGCTQPAAAAAAPLQAPAAVAAPALSELGVSDMVELLGGGSASSESGRPSKAFRSFNRDAVARRLQQLSDEQLLALAAAAVSSKPSGTMLPHQA